MSTPILPLAVWQSGTNQNSIPANDNSLRLEALNREIISQAVTAQPGSPADGDTYILPSTHTGAQWATFDEGDIVIFKGGNWYAWGPVEGPVVNVDGSFFTYDGSDWIAAGGGGGGAVDSVNGQTGVVVLDSDDVAEGTTNLYLTSERIDDRVAALLVAGTNIALTYDDTAGSLTIDASGGGGGGLTSFTDTLVTASPNGTINASELLASGGSTNQDAVFAAKGTGATLAQTPTGTTVGGDKRGTGATDWAKKRATSAQVASGADATISGGYNNRASGAQSAIGGGYNNISTANSSVVAGGDFNSATAPEATVAGGSGCTASGQQSAVSGGAGCSATADLSSVAGGEGNTASSDYAHVAGGGNNTADGNTSLAFGRGARTRGIWLSTMKGGGGTPGEHGRGNYIFRAQSSGTTPTVATALFITTPSASNQLTLAANQAITFSGIAVAKLSGSVAAKHWEFKGGIVRGGTAASIVMTAAVTPFLIAGDTSMLAVTLGITANTTIGCLTITCTGDTGQSIEWDISIDTIETIRA